MRIIAGKFGGRVIESSHGHRTHPMSEKVRGGLFNALGELDGLTVLDAFAGSGALSIEAVSRGAKHVTAIDIDKKAHAIIKKNAQTLGIASQIKPVLAGVGTWSANNLAAQFDIVLADPPYDKIQPELLTRLANHAKPGGIIVFSLSPKTEVALTTDYQLLTIKSYGDAQLAFYRKG